MNKSMRARFFLLSALFILVSACAKISSPSGGPRDRLPPVVVKSLPSNGSKNFKEKILTVTFDEYVVLDNINEKFMVSPPMKSKPRIFIKGKSVNVEFDDKLRDSTTYTFYFQDAIKDLNEGNIIENFQFVFSTGPVIDSLSVTGYVYNSFNLEVPEKTLVLMFRDIADSAVVKNLPDYISRVDQNGYFRINNVKSGTYRLYALKDVDNSKNYNLSEEEFAFMNFPVEITAEKNFIPVVKDTTTLKKELTKVQATTSLSATATATATAPEPALLTGEYQLILFPAQKKDRYLASTGRAFKYQMIYTLSLPPDSLKFEFSIPGSADDAYFTERSKEGDTLTVWLTDSTLYSQPQIPTVVKYPFTDTLGAVIYKEDTVIMRFLAPRPTRGVKIKKTIFIVTTNITSGTLKPGQQIVLKSQTPFIQPDTSRIGLYELSDTVKIKIPIRLIRDSINSCRYFLNTNLQEGKKYFLVANSGSFGDIYNEYSDSTGTKFSVRNADSYSKLTLIDTSANIRDYEEGRIIQLLNKSEKVIREARLEKNRKLVFPLIESGIYRIRSIYDLNGDGKWTTGDFTSGRQPEPVSYYPGEIEIKTGWEVEQEWNMGAENVKDQKLRENKKTR
ncbi:MAG TPA: Ig-like domain-containing domain [Anaerovoracaceae bacterium]|nr:Ig-like domain-containing domain [Anaerovoracaceae bacterium]